MPPPSQWFESTDVLPCLVSARIALAHGVLVVETQRPSSDWKWLQSIKEWKRKISRKKYETFFESEESAPPVQFQRFLLPTSTNSRACFASQIEDPKSAVFILLSPPWETRVPKAQKVEEMEVPAPLPLDLPRLEKARRPITRLMRSSLSISSWPSCLRIWAVLRPFSEDILCSPYLLIIFPFFQFSAACKYPRPTPLILPQLWLVPFLMLLTTIYLRSLRILDKWRIWRFSTWMTTVWTGCPLYFFDYTSSIFSRIRKLERFKLFVSSIWQTTSFSSTRWLPLSVSWRVFTPWFFETTSLMKSALRFKCDV